MDKKMMPMMLVMMAIMIAAVVFAVQGVNMHNDVDQIEENFHAQQEDYIVNNTKAERDNAEVGSTLSQQQAEIQNTPSELLRLKLVGVGKILTGIFVLLFGILMGIIMMPIRLGKILKKQLS